MHTSLAITLVALFTPAPVGAVRVLAPGEAAARRLPLGTLVYVVTLVLAADVYEVEALVALADVTPECVDALSKPWAGGGPSHALIHIHTGPAVRCQL